MKTPKFEISSLEKVEYNPPCPNLNTETQIEPISSDFTVPTILLTDKCWKKIFNIIKAAGEYEVGFLGTVEDLKNYRYLISDVFVFKQSVSAVECDFDASDLGAFYKEMLAEKGGKDILNKMMFWGHLHPHNDTGPSMQDDEQMDLFSHNDYFIRGIFTQTGAADFDFYDYKSKVKILKCPWTLHIEENKEEFNEIKKEVSKKSKVQKFKQFKSHKYSYSPTGPFYNFDTQREEFLKRFSRAYEEE